MKKPTISDVAEHAHVSKSTVSQFLNERFDYMREETRERIEKSIAELNYQPNVVARSLKLKSTATIGVIVANILHSFSTQVVRAIEDKLNDNNFSTIICNADDDPIKEKRYIETLLAKQVDGLIIFPTSGNIAVYQRLVDANYPIVFVDRCVSGLSVDTVKLENHEAAGLAVEHLVMNGYEDIAIMTTSLDGDITPRVERVDGYKCALERFQKPVQEEYIKGKDRKFLKQELAELFSLPKPPQAIISGNDLTLMEILEYATENGIKIGTDIGLVTIDEVAFAQVYHPSLTTVSQPTFEMGEKAADLLLNKFNSEKSIKSQIYNFTPSLIVRDSSKEVGVSHE
ncbi:substrate-binding domain-containing protein [Halobacillus shinanisalinarum]|uniref:Substrate-binding domain-containing protein n=1 Tax=Halobacillus shinanisalinarum TaxID=2932258 RepID=A0ABY4H604_9BACI|nr:substrate-binding domain-containing protein [Halobacillus shinanisalinarum]UOQ95631.1 substrate-binding domain-containing protein [Halobacillus shinanisalinarum]